MTEVLKKELFIKMDEKLISCSGLPFNSIILDINTIVEQMTKKDCDNMN
jgi:hypothetical protein